MFDTSENQFSPRPATHRTCGRGNGRFLSLVSVTVAFCVPPSWLAQAQNLSRNPSPAAVLQIDHVSFATSNLEVLRASLLSVGLGPEPSEPHGNATRTASIHFENRTTIEMIGPDGSGVIQGSDWVKLIGGDAGACFWAVVTRDLGREADVLRKRGVAVAEPEHGSFKLPDGVNVEWVSAQVGSGRPGSILPVLVEDQSPHSRRDQVSESARGAPVAGVGRVVIGVTNLDAAIVLYGKVFDWSGAVRESSDDFGRLAYFPGQPVILASPAGKGWLADHLAAFGEGPVAVLLAATNYNAASRRYPLSSPSLWFGRKVGWFPPGKLKTMRLGVVEQTSIADHP